MLKFRRSRKTQNDTSIEPKMHFDQRLSSSENLYVDVFGDLSPSQWLEVLVSSIEKDKIKGVEFPSFPPVEFQSLIHGHAAPHSLREAHEFYSFVRAHDLTGPNAPWYRSGKLLDFGSGWGRILRLFLLDFPLKNIIGFEPNGGFCSVARRHNPFISFLSSGFLPPLPLADDTFDLIIGWSIFSHLSEKSATSWLKEFSRILAPSGAVVMTTWGMRYLERLQVEEKSLERGEEIHWYSKVCLSGAGDVSERIEEYKSGKFVWLNTGNSDLYGEAFLSEVAVQRIIDENSLPFVIETYDCQELAQDAFILRRK